VWCRCRWCLRPGESLHSRSRKKACRGRWDRRCWRHIGSGAVRACFRSLEEVATVEYIVAEVLVDGAVELVRSSAGDDVDDAASGTSGLWSIAVGLDRDLLNAFDVRLHTDGSDHAFVVVDTINDPVVETLVCPLTERPAALVRRSSGRPPLLSELPEPCWRRGQRPQVERSLRPFKGRSCTALAVHG